MKPFFTLAFAVLIVTILGGCNIINPPENIPTYVHIDSFVYNLSPLAKGFTTSHKITNVVVYFNDNAIGNFDLPVTFPVIMNAPGVLTLSPGIDVDGLKGYEAPYNHYLADTVTISPNPGKTIYYLPQTQYTSYSNPNNFETFVSTNQTSYTENWVNLYPSVMPKQPQKMLITKNGFEGSSGMMILKASDSLQGDSMVYVSRTSFAAPYAGLPYLEMNYRCSMPIQIGMVGQDAYGNFIQSYVIGLNPHAAWEKVYIPLDNFTQTVISNTYNLIIRVDRPADDAVDSAFIDNLIILHK